MQDIKAARAALNTYRAHSGGSRDNTRDVQAIDLITDILLMFPEETAAQILATAEEAAAVDRPSSTPVYVGA